jgi:hypothetical protein
MAKSRIKSPAGLLSEAGKKAALGAGDAGRGLAGKRPAGRKSPAGNLSEAGRKAGRAVGRLAEEAVGMKPRSKKSGTK